MADSLSGLLGQIAGEFADRQQRGETPSIEEYATRFPDIATVLREVLPLLVAVPSTHITGATPGSGEPLPAVPNYEILGELGRGGMGVVYKAQQAGLGRTVALKMILAGVRASAEERARFLAEAEAIAQVRHPGIVAVHDFGTHDGAPFFSLEFCEGGSLAERLSGTPLLPGVSAQLVEQLAGAMQAAHNAGIVHRDLKPANVLLAAPPQPGDEWTVAAKISDFGLARFQHRDTGLTATGAIVGTPSYMAPEQARGASRHVGPAADVYALGAILYECLTGRPPFKAASLYDTLIQVAEQEPVPPRQLNPQIPVDLESITLTCLHKDPARRYPTAQALSEDLASFREGRPTWARPVGSWERGVKWARRRPALATLSAALVVGGLIALTVVTWLWQKGEAASDAANKSATREKGARQDAETAEQQARDTAQREALAKVQAREAEGLANRTLYLRNIAQANAQWHAGNARLAEVLLNECPVHLRGWEWRYLWAMVRSLDRDVLDHDIVARTALAANARGDRLVTAAGTRVMLHTADGQILRTLNTPGKTRMLAFCPAGKHLAAAPQERNWFSQVKIWDVGGKQVASLSGAACVVFRPDGQVLAHGSDQTIRLHDTTHWRSLASLRGHSGNVLALHFSAAGNYLASGDDAGQVILWKRLATENPGGVVGQIALPALGNLLGVAVSLAPLEHPLARIAAHKGSVETVALDPTGRYLATGGMDQVIRVWAVPGGNPVATLTGHPGRVLSLVWSPSGTRLFSGGHDGTIREWDPIVGRLVRVLAGHDAAISGVAFLGERLVSTGLDGTLRRWDDGERVCRSYVGHAKAVNCVAFHPDGKRAASGGEDKSVRLWDLERRTSQVLDPHGQACVRVLFDDQGKYLASVALDGVVHLWDVATTR